MGGTSVRAAARSTPPHPQYRQCPQPALKNLRQSVLKQKSAPEIPGTLFHWVTTLSAYISRMALARIITDAGACRFTASLLTRFLVITIIAKLLQQAFLIHNLLQALESTLDRLALLQSELDHACHLLSSPVSRH